MASSSMRQERREALLRRIEEDKLVQKYHDEMEQVDLRMRAGLTLSASALSVPDARFFVLSVQTFVENNEFCLPCEIAMIECSLKCGVINAFNQLVHPGQVPSGNRGHAKNVADKYHKIWLDNPELSRNYPGIVNRLMTLLRARPGERPAGVGVEIEDDQLKRSVEKLIEIPNDDSRRLLPIFVMPQHKQRAEASLKWLCNAAKMDVSFTLYSLPQFFANLVEASECESQITNAVVAEVALERQCFLYTPGVLCSFHYEQEVSFCAAGEAMRKAIILLDHCCQLFDIKPLRGKHYPEAAVAEDEQLLSESDAHLATLAGLKQIATLSNDDSHIMSGFINRS